MGKKIWANLVLCVVLGGLFAFGITSVSSALTAKGLFVTEPEPTAEVAGLLANVQLVNYNLSEDPNRMVRADFVVRNSSEQDVKNLSVQCEFFDPEGKFLDRKTWLLSGSLPAGKTITQNTISKRFVHSQAKGMQCQLVDFALVQEPAFVLHRVEGGHGGGDHDASATDAGHGAPAGH